MSTAGAAWPPTVQPGCASSLSLCSASSARQTDSNHVHRRCHLLLRQVVQGQPQGHAAHSQGKCGIAAAAHERPRTPQLTGTAAACTVLPTCRAGLLPLLLAAAQDLSSGQFIPDSDAISGAAHLTWVLQVEREIPALRQLHQACATRHACCLQAGQPGVGASCFKRVSPLLPVRCPADFLGLPGPSQTRSTDGCIRL